MNGAKNINCRVCLRFDISGDKCSSLFAQFKDSLISQKINSFVSFTIEKDDGLPDKICPECLAELENALQFREKCEKSNEILHSVYMKKVEDDAVIKDEPVDFDDTEESWHNELIIDDVVTLRKPKEESPVKRSRAIDLKLICDDCGGRFKSKCKLKVHWKKVHMQKMLLCQRCKRQFKSYKAFNKHKRNSMQICAVADEMRIEGTGKSRIFYCKACEYTTHRFKNLKSHLVTHTGERPFQCNMCSKSFTQIGSLHGHKESIHKEYRAERACPCCGKLIQGRTKMYKHMLLHSSARFQCDTCKKMFKTRQSLKHHMQRHSGYKAYTCEVCAASYYTSTDLLNHKRVHHTKFEQTACDLCGYVSKTYASMFKHKKKHTGTNICCLLCGKFLSCEQDFADHKKFHFGKKYPCPSCERTYNCRKSLRKHITNIHISDIANKPVTMNQKIIIKKERPQLEN